MRFLSREILGWFLVFLGLFLLYWMLSLILDERPRYLQASWMLPAGLIVFRGGIQILKVAVAARMCAHAQTELRRQDIKTPIGSPPPKQMIGQEW